MKRTFLVALTLVIVLISLRILFGFWVNNQFKKHLNTIEDRVYNIEYESIKVSVLEGTIRLDNFALTPRNMVLKKQLERGKNPELVASFTVDFVELVNVNYWDLVQNGLTVKNIAIENPALELFILPKPAELDSAKSVSAQTEFSYESITLGSFKIQNAKAQVYQCSQHDTVAFGKMDYLSFQVDGISYQKRGASDSIKITDAFLQIADVQLNDLNGYKLSLDSASLNFTANQLELYQGMLSPLASIEEFDKKSTYRKPYFEYRFDYVNLEKVEHRLLLYQEWVASKLSLTNFHAELYINNTLPYPPDKNFSFPVSKLKAIKNQIRLDSISLSDCSFTFRIPGKEMEKRAMLHFSDIDGTITGFTNKADEFTEPIKVAVTAVPYESGRIKTTWLFNLNDESDAFDINLKLYQANLPAFNAIIESTTHVHVESGYMSSLDFTMIGNNKQANGSINYALSDLNVMVHKVMNAEKKDQKFLSFILNKVVGAQHEDEKWFQSNYHINRPKQTPFFKFLWLGLQEGLKTGFIHNKAPKNTKGHKQKNKQ